MKKIKEDFNLNLFQLDGDICEIVGRDIFIDISLVVAIQLSLPYYVINISNSYIEVPIIDPEHPSEELLKLKNIWSDWKKKNGRYNTG